MKDHEDLKLKKWHHDKIESIFNFLKTKEGGLSETEVNPRQKKYGLNKLPEIKKHNLFVRFMYQFHNILIYVLLAASIVTAMLGHLIDSGVIFAVIILNAVIGFIQEGKAENALKEIQHMLSLHATVIRDSQHKTIDAQELVPGDIVLLQSGDKIPADLRLFQVKGLQVQESALTGESIAVEKYIDSVPQESVIGDRLCMAYSGTIVTHGKGSGIVTATGADTEIGRISTLVSEVEPVTTPLLRQMAQFGRWLTFAILIVAIITFIFGLLIREYTASEMFLVAVSLAVAAIPEGLPAIMTITLALGVQRMANRNAIIRKLPAVETLGAVSVICSDKTGTLTRNEMTVRAITTMTNTYELSGTGYNPHGKITLAKNDITVEENILLEKLSRALILCNDAKIDEKNSEWSVHGDPMEGALLIAALKMGLNIDTEIELYPRTDFIPFESEHRFMATLHHNQSSGSYIFIKGAPEQILEMCITQQDLNDTTQPLDKDYWQNSIEELAQKGQRILAIAYKRTDSQQMKLEFGDVTSDLTILGILGLIDPPREEAIDAVSVCHKAGIRVKMITGDHGLTARAIAKKLKLSNTKDVLTGIELESMSDTELQDCVLDIDIYARVNPAHKLRLVKLLQRHELIVAMTGDGVNDAPALKRADVGTAMGHNGTEAAKEAAEMVLADDNFASITHAIEEGRTVYDNLKKAILFILPTNGGEALIILAAIALGFHQMPLTPVQILWVNMVTAVTLALSLAFEPAEQSVMNRPPRPANEPILTSYLLWRVSYVSMILMGGTFVLFMLKVDQGFSIEYARTVAVNTLIMFEIFYLFNSRYISDSILNWKGLTGNRYVLIAIGILFTLQLFFTYLPQMQTLFGTTGISLFEWLRIVLVASSVLFLVELEKYIMRSIKKNV